MARSRSKGRSRGRGTRSSLGMGRRRATPRRAGVHRVGRATTTRLTAKVARFSGGHGPSIKAPRVYEALRRKGYPKSKAARISNAHANGTLDRGRGRRGPLAGRRS